MVRIIISLILLIASLTSCRSPKPEDLYFSYKVKESRQLDASLAALNNEQDSIVSAEKINLISILRNYKDDQYESAISLAENFYKDIPHNDTADLYYALSLMELSRFDSAQVVLTKLCENSQFKFQAEACWYYALVLLRDKSKWKECTEILDKTVLLDQRMFEPKVNAVKPLIKRFGFF